MADHKRDVAIIIGGSIAGLLAARVCHSHFRRVVVIERDLLPRDATHRRGVPQGRHPHVLHPAGCEAFDALLPGILSQLRAEGARFGDALHGVRRHLGGGYFARMRSGLTSIFTSRTVFEAIVRRRVKALPNVEFQEGLVVRGLVRAAGRDRIVGARVQPDGDRTTEDVLVGDIVVDASGRGSRVPTWLEGLGLEAPTEEELRIRLAFVTRKYELRAHHDEHAKAIVVAPTGSIRRGGAMLVQEDGRWIVTVAGYMGERPRCEPAGFVDFARSLAAPDIYDLIKDATPTTDLVSGGFPSNLRRRYESIRSPARGLVVIGDAICSFNPFAGQGMSVCAQQARVLAEWLSDDPELLPKRFFRSSAPVIERAWKVVLDGDRRLTGQPRGIVQRARDRYGDSACRAAHRDPAVARACVRTMSLLDPSVALLRPRVLLRVARSALLSRLPFQGGGLRPFGSPTRSARRSSATEQHDATRRGGASHRRCTWRDDGPTSGPPGKHSDETTRMR